MRFFTLNRNLAQPGLPPIAACDKALEHLVGDFLWYTQSNGIVYHKLFCKGSSRRGLDPTQRTRQRFEILVLNAGKHEQGVQYPQVDYRNHDPLDLRLENLFWLPIGEAGQPLTTPGEFVRTLPGYVEAVAARGKDIAANPLTRRTRTDQQVHDYYVRMLLETLADPGLARSYNTSDKTLAELGDIVFEYMEANDEPHPVRPNAATIMHWIYGHKRRQKDPEAQEWYRQIRNTRPPRLQGPRRLAATSDRRRQLANALGSFNP